MSEQTYPEVFCVRFQAPPFKFSSLSLMSLLSKIHCLCQVLPYNFVHMFSLGWCRSSGTTHIPVLVIAVHKGHHVALRSHAPAPSGVVGVWVLVHATVPSMHCRPMRAHVDMYQRGL